jgi:hypothetical protein
LGKHRPNCSPPASSHCIPVQPITNSKGTQTTSACSTTDIEKSIGNRPVKIIKRQIYISPTEAIVEIFPYEDNLKIRLKDFVQYTTIIPDEPPTDNEICRVQSVGDLFKVIVHVQSQEDLYFVEFRESGLDELGTIYVFQDWVDQHYPINKPAENS